MNSLSLAFIERLIPRIASAGLMFALAFFLTPGDVGLYALLILGVTLIQAVSDGAVRQVAVVAISTRSGARFLSQYQYWTATIGSALLAALIASIIFFSESTFQALGLLPALLVPTAAVLRVRQVAVLQSRNEWASLARIQAVAALVSLSVSIPTLIFTHALVASALQLAIVEALSTALLRRKARGLTPPPTADAKFSGAREFWHLSAYGLISWAQSQVDRVLLAWWAGNARLGLFSFSLSLGRAAGDAVSISTANVTRPRLLRESDERGFGSLLRKGLVMTATLWALTVAGTALVLRPLLGPEWTEALAAVPIVALSMFPTMVAWSGTAALMHSGRIRWASPIKFAALGFAIPIALSALQSIELAACWLVAREVAVMVATTALTRRLMWAPCLIAIALVAGGGAVTVALAMYR